jgi:uncharacterized protein
LTYITSFLIATIQLFGEMAPYLTFGFVLAGLLHAFVPRSMVVRHLGRESVGAAVKAAVIGVPMPLCSCGVIPTGIGLLKRGASRAAVISFLISTPQTGVDSIAVTYGFFGWVFAIFRPIAAFVSGIVGGIATLLLRRDAGKDQHWLQYHVNGEDALEIDGQPRGVWSRLRSGLVFAFNDLLGDIAEWLVLGLAIAALISLVVPDNLFAGQGGSGLVTKLIMMAFGIPLYVCSTASVPIAAVLMSKGVSAGAAFVFLMTGPATNAATMVIIGRVMGRRVLLLYLASISVLALVFGIGLDWLVGRTGLAVNTGMTHVHGEGFWNQLLMWGTAGLLTFFITLHLYNKVVHKYMKPNLASSNPNDLLLVVDGMSCSHCVRTVTETIKRVPGVDAVTVALDSGRAEVSGHGLDRTAIVQAISGVGYTVRPEETPPPYDALDEQ